MKFCVAACLVVAVLHTAVRAEAVPRAEMAAFGSFMYSRVSLRVNVESW